MFAVKRITIKIIIGLVSIYVAFAIFLFACSTPTPVNIELGNLPDNTVYYVGESDSVDLTGATVIVTLTPTIDALRHGRVLERPLETWVHRLEITDNIVFGVPGVYEVHIVWRRYSDSSRNPLVGRIPIQIIERE